MKNTQLMLEARSLRPGFFYKSLEEFIQKDEWNLELRLLLVEASSIQTFNYGEIGIFKVMMRPAHRDLWIKKNVIYEVERLPIYRQGKIVYHMNMLEEIFPPVL